MKTKNLFSISLGVTTEIIYALLIILAGLLISLFFTFKI